MAATNLDPRRGNPRQERFARLYDDEVLPLYAQRFGQMLLRAVHPGPRASVLEVGCATGYVTLEVLRRLDAESRIVALDSSSAFIDVARAKAGDQHAGKRIFFRTQSPWPKLPFAEDVYDLVISNLALGDAPDLNAALHDLARVTRPGGDVAITLPLRGTWSELLDIFREVLQKHDRQESLQRLDEYVAAQPEAEQVANALEAAGLQGVEVELERWELLFRSAREFFFAPLVDFGPLDRWKAIAGRGEEMQDVFFFIKEAIDAYFGGSAFAVSVHAGRISGRKGGSPG